jgi:hypothetical protein
VKPESMLCGEGSGARLLRACREPAAKLNHGVLFGGGGRSKSIGARHVERIDGRWLATP